MSLIVNSQYQTLDYIAGRDRNQREAVARPARVRFFIEVTGSGQGETRVPDLNFGALMMEEPTFTFGLIALEQVPIGQVPLATAVVLAWSSNENGIYTGADVGFRMAGPNVALRYKFSLTFEGSTLRSTANTGMNITSGASLGSQSPTLFRR